MTSGNGNSNCSNGESKAAHGESKAAQALVKSHILTHLIEGFVIQEGSEPFPVERPSFSIESFRRHAGDSKMNGLSPKDSKVQHEPMLTCELCGKVDSAYVFKRSKRFCSTTCAKRYSVSCRRDSHFPHRKSIQETQRKQRALSASPKVSNLDSKKKTVQKSAAATLPGHSVHLSPGDTCQWPDLPSCKTPTSPLSAGQRVPDLPLLPHNFLPSDPGQWNVEDVYVFICSLQGCLEIAEEFRSQEIDGQALLLLKEDHLMGAMNIKLGPALKIFAQINMLKDS
ncbi:polyhomeotic-like protein 2 [Neosynchiropus ocellatus]